MAACGDASDPSSRYLADVDFRRATLAASLIDPDNGYSRLRIAHYATGADGDWDRLPAWNPMVATLAPDGSRSDDEHALDVAASTDPVERLALGEAAFFRYPTQLWSGSLAIPALVSVRFADDTRGAALTCATCHARVVDGAIVAGLADEALDLGWGPGRIDVAPPPGEEPIAIPDLRSVALQTHFHRDGTVRNDGVTALAIRIETLIITSHQSAIRPPREVALALAVFLGSLAPAPAPSPTMGSTAARGFDLFEAYCASCHRPPTFSGPPVPLDVVGTDERVGLSADRGTGGYRAPSLRGVATRGRLLHDASVDDLEAFLDPNREGGHRFGLDLAVDDREALLAYLTTL
jgi:mono/diheme cytochrome c family protein